MAQTCHKELCFGTPVFLVLKGYGPPDRKRRELAQKEEGFHWCQVLSEQGGGIAVFIYSLDLQHLVI